MLTRLHNSPADAAVAAIRPLSLSGPFARAAEVVSNAGLEESENIVAEEKIRLARDYRHLPEDREPLELHLSSSHAEDSDLTPTLVDSVENSVVHVVVASTHHWDCGSDKAHAEPEPSVWPEPAESFWENQPGDADATQLLDRNRPEAICRACVEHRRNRGNVRFIERHVKSAAIASDEPFAAVGCGRLARSQCRGECRDTRLHSPEPAVVEVS